MHEQRRSNEGLLSALELALREENILVASVITMLIDVEDRRLHLELACSSMFDFCKRRLRMTDGEAFYRSTAARLAKRFPPLLDALRERRIQLSTIISLRKLFTDDNVESLIGTTAGKSTREVDRLIATMRPRADVPSSIRKLPSKAGAIVAPPVVLDPCS